MKAFKTLPEQYEQLDQYIQDQNKIVRPSLSDHQLRDINDKFIFKMYHDPTIELRYFVGGYIREKRGLHSRSRRTHTNTKFIWRK